jgi:PAB1-binding protein PBP1
MKRRLLATLLAAGMALSIPVAAFADDCHNVSRAAPANPTQMTVSGNWVWIPAGTFGGWPEASAWYFAVPGGFISQMLNTPNANGNYTNGSTYMLLGNSAICDPTKTANHTTNQGIQNECTTG